MGYIQKHELLTFKGNINMIISHKCWLTSGEKKEKMVCTADKNSVLKARLKTKIGKFCPKSVSLANPLRRPQESRSDGFPGMVAELKGLRNCLK